jgi:hypothetical protein
LDFQLRVFHEEITKVLAKVGVSSEGPTGEGSAATFTQFLAGWLLAEDHLGFLPHGLPIRHLTTWQLVSSEQRRKSARKRERERERE